MLLGVIALIATFWLAERTVSWLWMGELGYRPAFWHILDVRFALFAVAFVTLGLYFWLNMRVALLLLARWRRSTGLPIGGRPGEIERSSLLRRALPALLAFSSPSASQISGTRRSCFSMAAASAAPTR